MKKLCQVMMMFVVFLSGSVLVASPMTYIYEGAGSGSLNGVAFAESRFVITAIGDTDDVIVIDSSSSFLNHRSVSIGIDGVGSYEINTQTRTFVNNASKIAGFSRGGDWGADLIWFGPDESFASWDLVTQLDTVSGTGELMQWGSSSRIQTDGGALVFDDIRNMEMDFTAVPEPCMILMLGAGGLVLARKR